MIKRNGVPTALRIGRYDVQPLGGGVAVPRDAVCSSVLTSVLLTVGVNLLLR